MNNLIKSISNSKPIRYYVADTTEILKEIRNIHNPSPEVLIIFSKLVGFISLYGPSILSDNEVANLVVKSDGEISSMYAYVNNKSEIKVFIPNSSASLDNGNNVDNLIGIGSITIIKDLNMKNKYSGISNIVNNSLLDSFSNFMNSSEQIPTVISSGITFTDNGEIKKSGSYMIQLMPGYNEEDINYVEKCVNIVPESNILFSEFSIDEVTELISKGEYKILDRSDIKYKCDCSKERFISKVKTIGSINIDDVFDDKNNIEIICEYCKKKYSISREDIYE